MSTSPCAQRIPYSLRDLRYDKTFAHGLRQSVDGIYLWAQVYFLLRCGYFEEALNLLSDHQQSIKREDWSFPGAFKMYLSSAERRLPKTQKDQLYNDFNSHIRNNANVDQFKYALYKIVGRFELSRKTLKIATTTEDWMWLQLSLVREVRDESPQEQYDLIDLAKMVAKYGNEKFDADGTRPFAWFNLLLLTAQFEKVGKFFAIDDIPTDKPQGCRILILEDCFTNRRSPFRLRACILRSPPCPSTSG